MCGCSSVDMHVPICVLCVIPRARESNEREISSRTGHPTMPISEPKSRGAACGVRCTGAMRSRNTSAHRPRLLSLHTPAVSKHRTSRAGPPAGARAHIAVGAASVLSWSQPWHHNPVWLYGCAPRHGHRHSAARCFVCINTGPLEAHTQPGWPSGRWMSVQHMPKRKFVGADLP